MSILEAMSHGVPIVSTDVGGISEIVQFGYAGEATNGKCQSIIEAIERIVSNYEYYSQNAFEQSEQYYYLNANADILPILGFSEQMS